MTDRYEFTVCLALAGNLVEAREQLATVLTADIRMIVVVSTDPRLKGNVRRAFDLWVALAHKQYMDWCQQNLATVTTMGQTLREAGSPASLLREVDTASAQCQRSLGEAVLFDPRTMEQMHARIAEAIASERKTAREKCLADLQKAVAIGRMAPTTANEVAREFLKTAQAYGLSIHGAVDKVSPKLALLLGLLAGAALAGSIAGVLGGATLGIGLATLSAAASLLFTLGNLHRQHEERVKQFEALLEAIRGGAHTPLWWRLQLKTAGDFTVSL